MTHSDTYPDSTDRWLILAFVIVAVIFAAATIAGKTKPHAEVHDGGQTGQTHDGAAAPADRQGTADDETAGGRDGHGGADGAAKHHPHLWAVTPFVLLLGAIAVLPLLQWTEHWWESNRNRFIVAIVLGGVTLLYYLLVYEYGGVRKTGQVLEHAILAEYIPFIVLLFSLYTISGGIRIRGDLPAHPLTNTAFIALGGLLASFIGTTGSAMLLIRPLLETNSERKHVQHTVIFFIFVACNCGGCLLPIGDPPLFLGYLMGVNFLWTAQHLWAPWLAVNAALLAVYYAWDHFLCYPKEEKPDIRRDETRIRPIQISGLWPNLLLLLGVIFSVALLAPDPNKPFPGTSWVPWVYLREVVQLALVALSLLLGSKAPRAGNKFNYHAIVEVAALFIGIFICMQPAIEILRVQGKHLNVNTPRKAFWATGSLSSVLDNAPTYVVFFETAAGQFPPHFPGKNVPGDKFADAVSHTGSNMPDMTDGTKTIPARDVLAKNLKAAAMLVGISLGAVFMGSMTYIGNGPNFMVRAIAEESGVKMPSFFGYVFRYSAPVLIPIFFLATLVFL